MSSYWVRSGILTIAERLASAGFGFGTLFVLLRALERDEFGVWVLFMTVLSVIEVSRVGLLQNALVKYLSGCDDREYPRVMTASLFLNLAISAILIVGVITLSTPLGRLWAAPQLAGLLRILSLAILAYVPFHQLNFVQQANLDFRGIFVSNFFRQSVLFVYVVVHYVRDGSVPLTGAALCVVAATVAGAAASLPLAWRYLRFSLVLDSGWLRKLVQFGRFGLGTNVSAILYKSLDKMMLGSLLSVGSVAPYELAVRITNLADIPNLAVASVLFPKTARAASAGRTEELKQLYERSVGAVLALVLPGILVVQLFTEWIVTLIASEAYLDAVPLLRLTIFYGVFLAFGLQCGTILDSMGKPRLNFHLSLAGMILNAVFNWVFISAYGVMGAAYGTLLTFACTVGAAQIILYRHVGISMLSAFRHVGTFYREVFRRGRLVLPVGSRDSAR